MIFPSVEDIKLYKDKEYRKLYFKELYELKDSLEYNLNKLEKEYTNYLNENYPLLKKFEFNNIKEPTIDILEEIKKSNNDEYLKDLKFKLLEQKELLHDANFDFEKFDNICEFEDISKYLINDVEILQVESVIFKIFKYEFKNSLLYFDIKSNFEFNYYDLILDKLKEKGMIDYINYFDKLLKISKIYIIENNELFLMNDINEFIDKFRNSVFYLVDKNEAEKWLNIIIDFNKD